jgi:hypothetical protein
MTVVTGGRTSTDKLPNVKFDHFAKSIFQITFGVSLCPQIKLKKTF